MRRADLTNDHDEPDASLSRAWRRIIRALVGWLSGDSAYERFLTHWQSRHGDDPGGPLSRKEFFRERMRRKWSGINRCC
jgi:uncharacterized short protein YbdD (DUF466 family)